MIIVSEIIALSINLQIITTGKRVIQKVVVQENLKIEGGWRVLGRQLRSTFALHTPLSITFVELPKPTGDCEPWWHGELLVECVSSQLSDKIMSLNRLIASHGTDRDCLSEHTVGHGDFSSPEDTRPSCFAASEEATRTSERVTPFFAVSAPNWQVT
jgi:hypothetical protein